jgi:hypothetical protein
MIQFPWFVVINEVLNELEMLIGIKEVKAKKIPMQTKLSMLRENTNE